MKIEISSTIKNACPQIKLATISCDVQNSPTSDELWNEMEVEIRQIRSSYKLEEINKRPAISATRRIYKALGKDPNRYRPSAEALCRRIIREIPVYKVNTLVDIINIVSIRSGFSIGAFDAEKINGKVLKLEKGKNSDEFEAIGRGMLNVDGLPLYSDETGGIGTPTSDNERTKISDNTTSMFVIINAYNGEEGLQEAIEHTVGLLTKYACSSQLEICKIT